MGVLVAASDDGLRAALPPKPRNWRRRERFSELKSAMAVWMYNAESGALVGETYSTSARDAFNEDDAEGRDDISPYVDCRAAYIYSNAILPRYQRIGLGMILKAYFLGSGAAGYEVAIGHARSGGSVKLNAAFGARLVAAIGTGPTQASYFTSTN